MSLAPPTYETQDEMMKAGSPDTKCGRCGCIRKHHQNKKTFSYAKSGGSSGKSREILIRAITSCECPFCLCFCIGFIEPVQEINPCFYSPQGDFNNGTYVLNPSAPIPELSSTQQITIRQDKPKSSTHRRPSSKKLSGRGLGNESLF